MDDVTVACCLVYSPHPEPVSVSVLQRLNLHLPLARPGLAHLVPVGPECPVQRLDDIPDATLNSEDYSSCLPGEVCAAIVRWGAPVHHHVIVEHIRHLAAERRGRLVWTQSNCNIWNTGTAQCSPMMFTWMSRSSWPCALRKITL